MSEITNNTRFSDLGLAPNILERVKRLGFDTPTPIQQAAIPVALVGRDVVGIAQTGTGKTLAFGLPMISRLRSFNIGLVIAPTRELAQQIEETYHKLGTKTALLIGGAPMGPQIRQLKARPAVIVATPGRLLDHINQGTADLRVVSVVVLDEADRMLDMGFAPDIRRIFERIPTDRQTMLFSATMPQEIADMASRYLRNPTRIEVERAGKAAANVTQELIVTEQQDKADMLRTLLSEHRGSVLVFARTRHGARKLARSVRMLGHSAAEIHSDRTLPQRRAALSGFKSGEFRVLVATDIAARGIDVKDIGMVINYDVPQSAEDYVHRIGRTGRAGASGKAITFATPEQRADVLDIEKLLQAELPLSSRSPLPFTRPQPQARPAGGSRRSRGRKPSHGRGFARAR
jgi:ATP-dependent RNA helicase RhlE